MINTRHRYDWVYGGYYHLKYYVKLYPSLGSNAKVFTPTQDSPAVGKVTQIICKDECVFHMLMIKWSKRIHE